MLKDKALEIICKYGRTEAKVGLSLAERTIIFEALQVILALILQNVVCSVIRIGFNLYFFFFFEETYICHFFAYLLACFYEKHFKSPTSHIYFYLDDSELWKQYHSVSQGMMEQMRNLETLNPKTAGGVNLTPPPVAFRKLYLLNEG